MDQASIDELFLRAVPTLPAGWQVHHSLPQKYELLFREAGVNIHEVQFLRGVDESTHRLITQEWQAFDRLGGGAPSIEQIQGFARAIDQRYAPYFKVPGG